MRRFLQWLKSLFSHEINPYQVTDKVTFRNVDKTITLYVRSSAASLVVGLKQSQDKLKELEENASECERMNAARFFARSIFGEEQGDRLVDFYNEPLTIISVLGMYFEKQLSKKITKAQKK